MNPKKGKNEEAVPNVLYMTPETAQKFSKLLTEIKKPARGLHVQYELPLPNERENPFEQFAKKLLTTLEKYHEPKP